LAQHKLFSHRKSFALNFCRNYRNSKLWQLCFNSFMSTKETKVFFHIIFDSFIVSISCLDCDVSLIKSVSFSSSVKFDGETKCRNGVDDAFDVRGILSTHFLSTNCWSIIPLGTDFSFVTRFFSFESRFSESSSFEIKSRTSSESSSRMRLNEISDETQVSRTLQSITTTFYEQFLPRYSYTKKLWSQIVIREKLCKTLMYGKVERKMLMKMTPCCRRCRDVVVFVDKAVVFLFATTSLLIDTLLLLILLFRQLISLLTFTCSTMRCCCCCCCCCNNFRGNVVVVVTSDVVWTRIDVDLKWRKKKISWFLLFGIAIFVVVAAFAIAVAIIQTLFPIYIVT